MLTVDKWFEVKDRSRVHETLYPLITKIRERQDLRSQRNLTFAKLYGNTEMMGISSSSYSQPNPVAQANRVTWNVLQSCVDTQASKIAKNKPLPKFLTEGGNWEQQQKAQNLNKFIAGSFYKARVYESSARCFTDGGVFGTGLKKIYSIGKRIISERTLPDELAVDDNESWVGEPPNLYQRKVVARSWLAAMYPKFSAEITALKSAASISEFASNENMDQVFIDEAWHLPTENAQGKANPDGRHSIVIMGATLMDEEWTWNRFPFAKFLHVPQLVGFFGQGVCERHMGSQVEINKMLKNIQTAHHLGSNFMVMKEASSSVSTSALTNEIGLVCNYTGTMPSIHVFQTVHPEIYQHLERVSSRVFEMEGVSMLSAQSKKPQGLDSGKALREFNDIESERFYQVGQRYEQFHLDEAALHILCAKEIAKKFPDYAVPSKDRESIEFIRWKDVEMDEDAYIMQCFPSSSLPREPFARMQYVQELATSGYIDPETTQELMDFPDLAQYQSIKLAKRKLIREMVGQILSKGVPMQAEPYFDLAYGLEFAQNCYNDAKLNNCPEARLQVLRDFIDSIQSMISSVTPETQSPSPAPAGPGVGSAPIAPDAPLMPAVAAR